MLHVFTGSHLINFTNQQSKLHIHHVFVFVLNMQHADVKIALLQVNWYNWNHEFIQHLVEITALQKLFILYFQVVESIWNISIFYPAPKNNSKQGVVSLVKKLQF